jgi:hypothetical protein
MRGWDNSRERVTMTTSTTTALIRDGAFAPLASDVPVGMSLAEDRRRRTIPGRRWRTGLPRRVRRTTR